MMSVIRMGAIASAKAHAEKMDYVYNLRLLLQAYRRTTSCGARSVQEWFGSANPRPCPEGHRGCRAERSIREYIFRAAGISHDYFLPLIEEPSYLMRLARKWYTESAEGSWFYTVEGSWIYMWECVAGRSIRGALNPPRSPSGVTAELERRRTRKDFKEGGLRRVVLRHKHEKQQQPLRSLRWRRPASRPPEEPIDRPPLRFSPLQTVSRPGFMDLSLSEWRKRRELRDKEEGAGSGGDRSFWNVVME